MRLGAALARPLLRVFTRREWRGQEHIPLVGPAILVVNHLSYADPLIVAEFVYDRPRALRFLVKSSLFRAPVVGTILRGARQIPVYRETAQAGEALVAGVRALHDGHAVTVYPEGTCTKDPDLWPMQGKTGAARLALTTGAPVIPIVVWGAHRLHNPVTGAYRLRPRTPVVVSAGPPIDLTQFARCASPTPQALREATDVIMRRLRDDLAVLRGEPAPTGPLFVPPTRAPDHTPPQEVNQ